jgi:hypothetical protein
VLPLPKKRREAYRRMAQKAGRIWREHGALAYRSAPGRRRAGHAARPEAHGVRRLEVLVDV